jgi:hypothetical protein
MPLSRESGCEEGDETRSTFREKVERVGELMKLELMEPFRP